MSVSTFFTIIALCLIAGTLIGYTSHFAIMFVKRIIIRHRSTQLLKPYYLKTQENIRQKTQ